MSTPTTADLLKYANLQMAAEAFLVNDDGSLKSDLQKALIEGNKHSSVFTVTQAKDFTEHWIELDQKANIPMGFTRNLLKNKVLANCSSQCIAQSL
jgi:hypothetical protein